MTYNYISTKCIDSERETIHEKKILAGLLSAMMVVSLAACGNSETGATTTESKSETTANTADGTAAAATDAQGGYEGKEVKVWISSGAEDDIYREMRQDRRRS